MRGCAHFYRLYDGAPRQKAAVHGTGICPVHPSGTRTHAAGLECCWATTGIAQMQEYVRTAEPSVSGNRLRCGKRTYTWEGFQWIVPDDDSVPKRRGLPAAGSKRRRDHRGLQLCARRRGRTISSACPARGSIQSRSISDAEEFGGSGTAQRAGAQRRSSPCTALTTSISLTRAAHERPSFCVRRRQSPQSGRPGAEKEHAARGARAKPATKNRGAQRPPANRRRTHRRSNAFCSRRAQCGGEPI